VLPVPDFTMYRRVPFTHWPTTLHVGLAVAIGLVFGVAALIVASSYDAQSAAMQEDLLRLRAQESKPIEAAPPTNAELLQKALPLAH